jgi:hypothetical protein
MSFDPFPAPSQQPGAPGAAAQTGITSGPLGAALDAQVEAARERVQLPAMFLIAVGVLDLLFGLYLTLNFASIVVIPAEQLHKLYNESPQRTANPFANPEADKMLSEMAPDAFKRLFVLIAGVMAGVSMATALLVLFAGIRMRQLRSYGLCVLGSLTAAVPCLSLSGCAGIGFIVGVWSLVVLLSATVRVAFR